VDTSAETWDLVMGVNARGTFFVTKYAVPEMLKAGGGSIINLSSIWGVRGAPGYAAYCASKGAVRNFTKVTAVEHATQNIRANSLHPGVIDTPGLQGLINESSNPQATRAALTAAQPAGQFGKAEDVAWAAVFLASDESRFVSGCELSVDCALLAR
jgi:NAD(P)-dependent dehydrogenase (short-subunit alcohol dehydrogenase family)